MMELNTRHFARRILLINGLLLVIVLATVAAGAREIYERTRDQMITQAEDRQKLLAVQTASGIESHYQSILNDLDLLHRAENDETGVEKPGTEKTNESLSDRATDRAVASRTPLIGQVMWKQLEGRVSLLFSVDHGPNLRNPAEGRPGFEPRGFGGPRNMPPRLIEPRTPPDQRPLTTQGAPAETRVIGSNEPRLVASEILQRSRQWIDQLQSPSISPFDNFSGIGANLICIPKVRGRDLVAVVPISGIEKQFLKPLNADPATGAWLIDAAGIAMAASRPELVGTSVTGISDPELHELAKQYVVNHATGTQLMPRKFVIGSATFMPAMITALPVNVGNKQWELFVTTSLDDVDGVVAKLFHRAMLWCIFVVVSITAILVSTAIQMIRTRMKMERHRHECLTKELCQARDIQLAWLPNRQPFNAAIDVAAVNNPASHISGDFYNWFELPDGRLAITVGDVTGHGMAAAFLMATTQLLVRNTMSRVDDPGRCLEEVNRQLCVQVFNGQFVTMVLLILDVANGRMQVATAGHPAPLLADGESFQPLPLEPQLVLGVDRDTQYITENFELSAQASLLLYTDGVVECPCHDGTRFTTERLRRTLYGRYDTAKEMLHRVVTAVNTFRGIRPLDDDLTLVAVQLQSSATPTPDNAAAAVI